MLQTNTQVYAYLWQQLNDGATLITPNRRLSASLQIDYQNHQVNQQKTTWQTADILPVTTWMQRCYAQMHQNHFSNKPVLLNSAQEKILWQRIIQADTNNDALLQLAQTADIAQSAWNSINQWLVSINHPLFTSTDDYHAFVDWAKSYILLTKTHNWIDAANIAPLIATTTPRPLILFGFTEISPQLNQLLKQFNHTIIELPEKSSPTRISLKDQDSELFIAARYAKALHDQDNSLRIGCVVPNLESIRDRVSQIFTSVFSNQAIFNLSAGQSLRQCPIINTALQLLNLHKKNIPLATFSHLLTSPFLGQAETERIQRAFLDSQLRRDNINTITLPLDIIKKFCPLLDKKLSAFLSELSEQPNKLSCYAWRSVFTSLLTTIGWPGERSLNSEEYQIVEHWLQLLDTFASLDLVIPPLSIQDALSILNKLATESIFHPKSPTAPIQILGQLEAAGLRFDYLWVSGMDDMNWPPQPKPNPLIPKKLQRELGMPHATAEREYAYCQSLIQQYRQCATQLIFSHAEMKDDLECQASALIQDYPSISQHLLSLSEYEPTTQLIFNSKMQDQLIDECAPSYLQATEIQGGVSVLKQQALCPFKAFAEIRLHARELESPLPGLKAKDRGTILHKAMELVWNSLQTQHALLHQSDSELKQIIDASIDQALDTLPRAHQKKSQYFLLEKQRLYKLIRDWLSTEKNRPPFQVLLTEKSEKITLNQLTYTVKVDRIDLIENDKKLIIDYKTGHTNSINHWFGDRPDEPQLPLYAQLDPDHTIGITFAQVTTGDPCFKGISHVTLNIEGITTKTDPTKPTPFSWHDQLNDWKLTLTRLSDEFYRGHAKVDPKDNTTCQYCALTAFCRINEEMPR